MTVRTPDFKKVAATPIEVQDYRDKHKGQRISIPQRSVCVRCRTRIWHVGIAIATHRQNCPLTPPKAFAKVALGAPRVGYGKLFGNGGCTTYLVADDPDVAKLLAQRYWVIRRWLVITLPDGSRASRELPVL